MPKKLHWTQTPEGRAKLSRQNKARWNRTNTDAVHEELENLPKTNNSFKVTIEKGGTKFQITDVPRRTIVGFIGKLMRGK